MSTVLSLAELESFDSHAKKRLNEKRFLCPMCGDKKPRDTAHRSLSVNTRNGKWICFRCGEKGMLKEFWSNDSNNIKSRRQRVKLAVDRAFVITKKSKIEREATQSEMKGREMWEASTEVSGTPGATYLIGRGLTIDAAINSGVRFTSNWYGRPAVLFPMRDRQGDLIAINARFVDGRTDFKTQTAGPKSSGVFMTPDALSQSPVAVVEAPIDALSLWLCGIPSVAMAGTSWPDWLPSALGFKSVLIATDADVSGDEAATKLVVTLNSSGAKPFRLRPQDGKDWNELLKLDGRETLCAKLKAYSQSADDEIRVDTSWDLLKAGHIAEAEFIASLIADAFTREIYRARMRRELRKRDVA